MHRVQDQIARRWQGVRQQIADAPALGRLAARKRELILAAVLSAFFDWRLGGRASPAGLGPGGDLGCLLASPGPARRQQAARSIDIR